MALSHAAPGIPAARRIDPPRWWARVRARAWHWSLDSRIASGADPRTSPALQARAEQLVAPPYRARLAANLELVVAGADEPYALTTAAALRRGPLREARDAVLALAARLRDAGDTRPQGVAIAVSLLTDVAGPLYNPAAEDGIDDTARRATAALG